VSEVDPKIRRRIRREVLRRGLDRRKVYCLTIDGEVGTLERFTGVCSGCRCDCRDGYPCSHGAGGCDECGYTGKRVTLFGVPVTAETIKPLSAYRRANGSQAKRIAGGGHV
jgi:hypothetical protein